jgi:hypothetical protein
MGGLGSDRLDRDLTKRSKNKRGRMKRDERKMCMVLGQGLEAPKPDGWEALNARRTKRRRGGEGDSGLLRIVAYRLVITCCWSHRFHRSSLPPRSAH